MPACGPIIMSMDDIEKNKCIVKNGKCHYLILCDAAKPRSLMNKFYSIGTTVKTNAYACISEEEMCAGCARWIEKCDECGKEIEEHYIRVQMFGLPHEDSWRVFCSVKCMRAYTEEWDENIWKPDG